MSITRLIEFVFIHNDTPHLGLFDVADISSITELDKRHSILTKKDKSNYKICGNFRTTTNRWIYTLEKRNRLYDDYVIRPSNTLRHNPLQLGVDNIHFDKYQLESFILSVNPEILNKHPNILTD